MKAMKTSKFDPLEYIESAFLDKGAKKGMVAPEVKQEDLDDNFPSLGKYIQEAVEKDPLKGIRFRKTEMSAPRPRKSKEAPPEQSIDPEIQALWEQIPRNMEFLCRFFNDSVTSNYYQGDFKESREELVQRLMDPELSLEETSRLLGVCPATVRRYTNRGWLTHHRTQGGQRRFRLSDLAAFIYKHGRLPEA